jgi:glyoxylase-like metal-dependent hydrolase (beta-lactamase superfamily II)
MAQPGTTIVYVGYKSTNFWVISAGSSRLLVDLGWAGTMGSMRANLERAGVPLKEIKCGLATHYHMDHAGLAQELKNAGMKLWVVDVQVTWIARIRDHIKPSDNFTDIAETDNTVFSCAESRARLAALGISGQVVHTPGHSPDSVSLLLDSGEVFTGDLTHPMLITEAESEITTASWQLLQQLGATTVYPGHGPIRPLIL